MSVHQPGDPPRADARAFIAPRRTDVRAAVGFAGRGMDGANWFGQ